MTGKTIYLVKVWYYDTAVGQETDFIAYSFFDYKSAVDAQNAWRVDHYRTEIIATALLYEEGKTL